MLNKFFNHPASLIIFNILIKLFITLHFITELPHLAELGYIRTIPQALAFLIVLGLTAYSFHVFIKVHKKLLLNK